MLVVGVCREGMMLSNGAAPLVAWRMKEDGRRKCGRTGKLRTQRPARLGFPFIRPNLANDKSNGCGTLYLSQLKMTKIRFCRGKFARDVQSHVADVYHNVMFDFFLFSRPDGSAE